MSVVKSRLAAEETAEPPGGADTHERISLAAQRLFAEREFDGVSVRDIVAEAGVNLAAINYHFGSKSALLFEIFSKRARIELRTPHSVARS